jgi:leader peptidase (prepilin peptidase)/N-methyltransferase
MGWLESLSGGLVGAALLFGLRRVYFIARGVEGLGLGDVKLMLPLGFMCGLYSLPLLLLAASLSALAVSACRLAGGRGWASIRSARIPFGPFLAFGCFIAVLYGEKIH